MDAERAARLQAENQDLQLKLAFALKGREAMEPFIPKARAHPLILQHM